MPPKTKPTRLTFQESLDLLNKNMQQKRSTFPILGHHDATFLKEYKVVDANNTKKLWQYFSLLMEQLINTSLVIDPKLKSESSAGTRFLKFDERRHKKGIHDLLEEIVRVLRLLNEKLQPDISPDLQERFIYLEFICEMHNLGSNYFDFTDDVLAKVAPLQHQLLNSLNDIDCPNSVREAEALAFKGQALNALPDYRKEYLLFGFANGFLRNCMELPLNNFATIVHIIQNLIQNKLFPSCCEVLEETNTANHFLLIVQRLYAQVELFKANYGLKANSHLYNNRYCQPIDAILESLIEIECAFFVKITAQESISFEILHRLTLHLLILKRAPKFSANPEKKAKLEETLRQISEVGGTNWILKIQKLNGLLEASEPLTEARGILSEIPKSYHSDTEQKFSQEEKTLTKIVLPESILAFASSIQMATASELLLSGTTVAKLYRKMQLTNPIQMIALSDSVPFESNLIKAQINYHKTPDSKTFFIQISDDYIYAISCQPHQGNRRTALKSIVKPNVYNVARLLLSLNNKNGDQNFWIFGSSTDLLNLQNGWLTAVKNVNDLYKQNFCYALELVQHKVDFNLNLGKTLERDLQKTNFERSFRSTPAKQIAKGLKATLAPCFNMMAIIKCLGQLGFLEIMTGFSYEDLSPLLPILAPFNQTDVDTKALAVALSFTTYFCTISKDKQVFANWRFRPILEELAEEHPEYLQGLLYDLQNDCGLMRLTSDPCTLDVNRLKYLFQNRHGYACYRNYIYYVDRFSNVQLIGAEIPGIFLRNPNILNNATPPQLHQLHAATKHNRSFNMIKDQNLLAMIDAIRTQAKAKPPEPGPLSAGTRFILFSPAPWVGNRAPAPQNSWAPQ